MRGLKISWVLAVGFLGAMASFSPACGGTGEGETGTNSSGGNGCTPGKSEMCVCSSGQQGAQVCQPNGTFGPCECGGGSGGSGGAGGSGNSKCGNEMVDEGEQCDDGNTASGDGCSSTCQNEDMSCPNGIPEPGECGPEGTCPMDCGLCGNDNEDPNECGPKGGCPEDCCLPQNTQIYASMVPSSGPVWQYQGLTGLDAGNAACQAMGADHACTYEEIKEAEKQGELTVVPAGTTVWYHRTMPALNAADPGAGCRCNEWKYNTNHISDGEFGVMQANGVLQDNLDSGSCLFDANNPGMYTVAGLDCGGANRAIFCCFAECVLPPVP